MSPQVNRPTREVEACERAGQTAFDYQLHGGKGTAKFQWYFLDQSRLPVAVQRWDLEPGASEGMHVHDAELPLDELYLVIDGDAKMNVNGRVYLLESGDALLAPAGSEHDVVNIGDSTLRLVVIFGAPSPADWSWSQMATASRASGTARPDVDGSLPRTGQPKRRPDDDMYDCAPGGGDPVAPR